MRKPHAHPAQRCPQSRFSASPCRYHLPEPRAAVLKSWAQRLTGPGRTRPVLPLCGLPAPIAPAPSGSTKAPPGTTPGPPAQPTLWRKTLRRTCSVFLFLQAPLSHRHLEGLPSLEVEFHVGEVGFSPQNAGDPLPCPASRPQESPRGQGPASRSARPRRGLSPAASSGCRSQPRPGRLVRGLPASSWREGVRPQGCAPSNEPAPFRYIPASH